MAVALPVVVTPAEMQALERRAFAAGVSAEELMDLAGAGIAEAVQQFFPSPGVCLVVFGKGHNGADALVAARHLAIAGWETFLLPAFPEGSWSALTAKKFGEAGLCRIFESGGGEWFAALPAARSLRGGPLVVLDGLLGVGASGPLRGPLRELAARINELRATAFAQVVAVDLPTGLDGETGAAAEGCVVADLTVTLGFPKRGLLADGAADHVGRLALVPLPQLAAPTGRALLEMIASPAELASLLKRRPFESHKGLFGRISIVAGSRGFTGAALLCSAACVRAGAGLVSLYVTEEAYPIIAAAALPEVMVHAVRSYTEVLETKCDVLALGPGLGRTRAAEVEALIRQAPQPMVIDADGLNILSEKLDLLAEAAGPRLLTPHPGEMARLFPEAKAWTRHETATRFVERHPVALLLKGARTIMAEKGRAVAYNTTGNAGMATGGMGDVLTGVCAALAGQRLALYDAARVGAWVCGRAAELALAKEEESLESLTPSGLLRQLGPAFRQLHARRY